jgi:hypothetical protein
MPAAAKAEPCNARRKVLPRQAEHELVRVTNREGLPR